MKTVIAGLEEGLNAIADALEGGGGGGGEGAVVPVPTLEDESKVLKAIPQSQTRVAPEWGTVREVPIGGEIGQVLTKNSDDYGWSDLSGLQCTSNQIHPSDWVESGDGTYHATFSFVGAEVLIIQAHDSSYNIIPIKKYYYDSKSNDVMIYIDASVHSDISDDNVDVYIIH